MPIDMPMHMRYYCPMIDTTTIRAIFDAQEYEHYGLRVIPMGDTYQIGDVLPDSWVWDDGNWTDDALDGVSALSCSRARYELDNLDKIIPQLQDYHGDIVVLVGSQYAQGGNDLNEIVMRDGVVLAIFEK